MSTHHDIFHCGGWMLGTNNSYQSLVAYYPLHNNLKDYSIFKKNANSYGSISFLNNSLYLNGNNNYIDGLYFLKNNTSITICINVFSTDSENIYRSVFDGPSGTKPMIWFNPNGQIEFDTSLGITSVNNYRNKWVNLCLTKEAYNSYSSYFINGEFIGKALNSYQITDGNLSFFNRNGMQTFKGYAKDIRIFEKILSFSEIKNLYNVEY